MKENENIQITLHCLKTMLCTEHCEECPVYGKTGTDHCEEDAVRCAIKALEEIQQYKALEQRCQNIFGFDLFSCVEELKQYRALGTVEELKQAKDKQISKNLVDIIDETFGDTHTVCPSCKSGALVNPYRAGREGYPYCPWCGQKLDWAEPFKRLECE